MGRQPHVLNASTTSPEGGERDASGIHPRSGTSCTADWTAASLAMLHSITLFRGIPTCGASSVVRQSRTALRCIFSPRAFLESRCSATGRELVRIRHAGVPRRHLFFVPLGFWRHRVLCRAGPSQGKGGLQPRNLISTACVSRGADVCQGLFFVVLTSRGG